MSSPNIPVYQVACVVCGRVHDAPACHDHRERKPFYVKENEEPKALRKNQKDQIDANRHQTNDRPISPQTPAC